MFDTRSKRRAWKEEWVDIDNTIKAEKPKGKEKGSYFISGSHLGVSTLLAGIMHHLVNHHIMNIADLHDLVDCVDKEVKRNESK